MYLKGRARARIEYHVIQHLISPLMKTLMTSVHKSVRLWTPRPPQTLELSSFREEEDELETCQSFLTGHSRPTNKINLVDSGTIYKSTGTGIPLKHKLDYKRNLKEF